jgi:hypothetical protein
MFRPIDLQECETYRENMAAQSRFADAPFRVANGFSVRHADERRGTVWMLVSVIERNADEGRELRQDLKSARTDQRDAPYQATFTRPRRT